MTQGFLKVTSHKLLRSLQPYGSQDQNEQIWPFCLLLSDTAKCEDDFLITSFFPGRSVKCIHCLTDLAGLPMKSTIKSSIPSSY